MKTSSILTSLCLLLLLAGSGQAQEGKADKAKSKGKEKEKLDPAAEVATDGIGAMGKLIPEGMRNLKVGIPGFQNGQPSSLITAEALTRKDANSLFAEDMIIKIFGATPKEDVKVTLRTATYKMDAKTLSSEERSRVARSDFFIEGDTMVFDTATSQGKMVGRVHMVIYDTSTFSQRPAVPATPEAGANPPPAKPGSAAATQPSTPTPPAPAP